MHSYSICTIPYISYRTGNDSEKIMTVTVYKYAIILSGESNSPKFLNFLSHSCSFVFSFYLLASPRKAWDAKKYIEKEEKREIT